MKEVKKLTLNRETLKVLTDEQLTTVVGGYRDTMLCVTTATTSCTQDTYCYGSAWTDCPI